MDRRHLLGPTLTIALAMISACATTGDDEVATPDSLVGREAVDMVQDVTVVLSGIQNLPQAQEALPRLEQIDTALSTAVQRVAGLSEADQQRVAAAVAEAAEPMDEEVDRVQAIGGVPGTIRPTLDSIRGKVLALQGLDGD